MNPLDFRSPDLPDSTLIALWGLLWWSIVAVLVLLAAELVRFVGLTVRALRRNRLTFPHRFGIQT